MLGVTLCISLASCGSENRDNAMDDTGMVDTSMVDTAMNDNIDTTGVADTAGVDTMYRNSPAKSDNKPGNAKN